MIDADDDEAVQVARPLPAPMTPSKAQREAHECTHQPYRSWCPHCVAARRSNSQHRRSSSLQRPLPLLVANYCQLKNTDDGIEDITVLVARLYPARALLATVVDAKGPDGNAVARVANFIRDSGYSRMVYRTDHEASIRSLFEEAFRRSQRQGSLYNERLEQFTPETSAVREFQSNGKAGNAAQRVEDLVRTYKAALESRIKCKVPIGHPIMRWMAEHPASLYNRYVTNEDGATPFEVLHGQRFRCNIAEFGEQCLYFVPKKLRAKLNLRFRMGTFLGDTQNSNEAFVANAMGEVILRPEQLFELSNRAGGPSEQFLVWLEPPRNSGPQLLQSPMLTSKNFLILTPMETRRTQWKDRIIEAIIPGQGIKPFLSSRGLQCQILKNMELPTAAPDAKT